MLRIKGLLFFLFYFLLFSLHATHQRAGEITYKHISGLTYEFKLVTYTYTPSPADRPELEIVWGDGSSSIVARTRKINLPNDISENIYIARHTFASSGYYTISMEDPNRNAGIVNIPNSVNIPFYVQTTLLINPFLGANSSPQLLNPPIDNGCVNKPYYHNPGAFDIDGDSLSYKLITCRGFQGENIPGYSLPFASNFISIDAMTGDLIWDSPPMQGEYNIAIQIEEWRNGVLICEMVRDMQIIIVACDNEPPEVSLIQDTCVLAGTILELTVTANDINSSQVTLSATGLPLQLSNSPATFPIVSGAPPVTSLFSWNTQCEHVRLRPYQVSFKAIDNGPQVNLVNFKTLSITVVALKVENVTATPQGNTVEISWQPNVCQNVAGYSIYKRVLSYDFTPDHCETGLPAYTGYRLIGQTFSHLDTVFIDDGSVFPLHHGNEYCYRIVAFFSDGAESYVSDEVCTYLLNDAPLITHVDVKTTDEQQGKIYISWENPTELDTNAYSGFQYRLYRTVTSDLSNFSLIFTGSSLQNRTFLDSNLNTVTTGYTYKVELWGKVNQEFQFIECSDLASSIFLYIDVMTNALELSWQEDVPWHNVFYTIWKYNLQTQQFDSLTTTENSSYIDRNLQNGVSYCYFIKSTGGYFVPDSIYPLYNNSQQKCVMPSDIDPPAIPNTKVTTDCENVFIEWSFDTDTAYEDVYIYYIYYKPTLTDNFAIIDSFYSAGSSCYYSPCQYTLYDLPYITGCFALSAKDTAGNESEMSEMTCFDIDDCVPYLLPNVFTPDGDGINDFFTPFLPYYNVKSVNFTVYNRWGGVVFKTQNPDLNWNGENIYTKQPCTDGTYFYVCEVYLYSLKGIIPMPLHGTITIIRSK